MAAPARREHPRIRLVVILANLLLFALLVVLVMSFKEERSIAHLFSRIDPRLVLIAALLQGATYFATGGAWRVILGRFTSRVSLIEIVILSIEKITFDQIFPTLGVGGSFAVIRSLTRRGVEEAQALAMVIIDAACYYAAYLALFGLSAALLFLAGDFGSVVRGVVVAFFALLGSSMVLVIFLIWRLRARGTLGWLERFEFARTRAAQVAELPLGTFRPNYSWLLATLLEAAVFLLDAATLWLMFAALGYPLTAGEALIALMFSSAAAALSAIPGGIGFFEGAGILVIHEFGIPYNAATAGILLLRGFTYWLPLLPGYLLLRAELTASD